MLMQEKRQLSAQEIVRALKDPEYRERLSVAQRAQLPMHPAGPIELPDALFEQVAGGGTVHITFSGVCA
jgi:mersacidin/lichenicidin family type 2 lantibiotic